MDTNTTTAPAQPGEQAGFSQRLRHSKALIPTLAVMAVTVAALATTLVVTQTSATGNANTPVEEQVVTAPPLQAPKAKAAPAQAAARPVVREQRHDAQLAANAPVRQAQAPVCHTCGVVESVVAVQRPGQAQGIAGTPVTPGTVIGGVVGGLLGNQIGHGNGRAAATVLGAAGGAYAGNVIEKNVTKVTVYQMRIRMNDGTVRTVEQGNAVAAGSRVVLDGGTVRAAPVSAVQG
jgi:outer membrane lipoprotein SlyB